MLASKCFDSGGRNLSTFDDQQASYQRLKKAYAERRKPLTFWVGAGLSMPAGLPSWAELRDSLLREAVAGLDALDATEADLRESELQRARQSNDLWQAFSTIRKMMGEANYSAAVRNTFEDADRKGIPAVYNAIWRLSGVQGMVSLNIDQFSDRAFSEARPGLAVASFVGRDAHSFAHMIGAQRPFIANLHGIHPSDQTWIFTDSELKALFDNKYRTFLTALFSATTVVFCGISADDQAAGGFISDLVAQGIDLGSHYWITSRRDSASTRWANDARIQVVRYSADTNADHTKRLLSIIKDLDLAKSKDIPAAVVVPNVKAEDLSLDVRRLKQLDDDELRSALSSQAKAILEKNNSSTDNDEYREFLSNYSPVIHSAWHVTDRPPYNSFYGRRVVEKISSGSFSTVWRLDGDGGEDLALKVLVIDNLDKGPSIQSFRRGVESLSYLTNADVPGTAKLVEAYEMPTAVVMKFIEGSDFSDVIVSRSLNFWTETISVLLGVCRHLKHGHNLPHSVLHRDVRPSNIMLPYIYWDEQSAVDAGVYKFEAVLINYDMSWHADAHGKTIPGNLNEAGYYSPEQLSDEATSRSTLVDSYGLGMTIYFAYTKSNPPTGGSRSGDWEDTLRRRFRPQNQLAWRSAPERLRRMILNSTWPEQPRRWSISQIEAELSVLQGLFVGERRPMPPDYWAEEVIARVAQRDYFSNDDASKFRIELRQGRSIEVSGDLTSRSVEVRFRNLGTDGSNWTGADKLWRDKLNRARDILSSSGWEILDSTRYSHMDILLHVRIPIQALEAGADKVVDSLARGIDLVRLD